MQILNSSLDDLGRTLQGNRAITLNERERAARLDLDREMMGLRKEEMGLRRGEAADSKANRGLMLQSQAAHQQRLEAIQKEGNETKRNQMYLEFLGELNKSGQLTDEGLSVMEQKFNEQFGPTGLGVKLFRRAEPPTPTSKDMGGGVRTIYIPGSKEAHVIDERETVTDKIPGTDTEPERSVQRRVAPGEAAKLAPKPAAAESIEDALKAGQRAPMQKELTGHLDEIKKGDTDYGFLNGKSRVERVKELQRQMAELDLPAAKLTNAAPGQVTQPKSNVLPGAVSDPAGPVGGATVTMRDPKGNLVKVPRERVAELKAKGYK